MIELCCHGIKVLINLYLWAAKATGKQIFTGCVSLPPNAPPGNKQNRILVVFYMKKWHKHLTIFFTQGRHYMAEILQIWRETIINHWSKYSKIEQIINILFTADRQSFLFSFLKIMKFLKRWHILTQYWHCQFNKIPERK